MKYTKDNIIGLQFSYENRLPWYTITGVNTQAGLAYGYHLSALDDRSWDLKECLNFLNKGTWKPEGYIVKTDNYEIY